MATQIPKIQIGNLVRDMTTEEIAELNADKAAYKEQQKEAALKAQAKADVIAKLGLTAEEVAALLS
jgi:hypothetical protein